MFFSASLNLDTRNPELPSILLLALLAYEVFIDGPSFFEIAYANASQ